MPDGGFTAFAVAVKAFAVKYATAITIAQIALTVASVAYTVRSNQIAKQRAKQAAREAQGITQMVRNSTAAVGKVYGERRISGPIIFVQEEGTDRKFLHMVIALTAHEVQEIKWVWFDDQVVSFNSTTGEVTSGNFATKAWVWTRLGAPGQTAFENLVYECPGFWTSAHKLEGCAAVYVKLEYDQKVYSNGLPNISVTVRGAKLYDFRDGVTRWSANPALIAADMLMDSFVGAGVPQASIDSASVIEAANICDEQLTYTPPAPTDNTPYRYSCHHYMDSSTKLEENLQAVVDCMAGVVTRSSGKWFIRAGAYRTPTVTLTDSDFLSGVKISPRRTKANLCNRVRGVFVDPSAGYVAAEFPPVKNATYLSQDNGEELWLDMDLGATVDPVQAQRLAKIELEKSRQQISVQGEVGLRGLQLMPGDTVMLTLSRMGWTSKVFEVVGWVLDMNGDGDAEGSAVKIGLALQETSPSVYTWSTEETVKDDSPDTDLPNPFAISAPTDLTITQEGALSPNGDWQVGARLNWVAPADGYVQSGGIIRFRFKRVVDTTWTEAGTVEGNMTTAFLPMLLVGVMYHIEIQSENSLGAKSNWVSGTPLIMTLAADTTPPAVPYGVTISNAVGREISLTWVNPTEKDFAKVEVWRHTSDSVGAASPIGATSGNRFTDTSITPGVQYYYWLRSVDYTGNFSAYSSGNNTQAQPLVQADVNNAAPSAPASVIDSSTTGTYGSSDGAIFAYLSLVIPAQPTTVKSTQLLYRKLGASEWMLGASFANTGGTTTLRLEDLTPGVQYEIQRRYVSFSGTLGALAATTPALTAGSDTTAPWPPCNPVEIITTIGRVLTFHWTNPTDKDLKAVDVYRNTSDDLGGATKVGTVAGEWYRDTSVVPGTRYYYWAKAFDYSGNYSDVMPSISAVAPALTQTDVDTTAPAAPVSVFTAESTGVYIGTGGTAQAWLQFTIAALPTDVRATQLLYRRYPSAGADWQVAAEIANASPTTVRIEGLQPGSSYSIQRRYVSFSGTLGALVSSTPISIAGLDATAPAAPTSVSATDEHQAQYNAGAPFGIYNGKRFSWVNPTDADFSHCEVKICVGSSDSSTINSEWDGDQPWKAVPGATYLDAYRPGTGIQSSYAFVRSVDLFGNASAWVSIGSVSPTLGVGDLSAQNRSATVLSGVSTGATSASSVRKVLARYPYFGYTAFTAPGGTPEATVSLDISNRGFATRPDVGLVELNSGGWSVYYNIGASTSTSAVVVLRNPAGNFAAGTYTLDLNGEFVEYD